MQRRISEAGYCAMILAHVKCKRVLLIQYKAKDVFRLRRLSTLSLVFVFFLSNDVRHEGASIFLPWTIR